MHLIYRGSVYTPDTTNVDLSESDIAGKYRGVPITFKSQRGVAQPQAVATLMYRGISYLRARY